MGYYKNVQKKIEEFQRADYDYYMYGLYPQSEDYDGRRKMYASGVRDKSDVERFLKNKENLSSFRIFSKKGEKINIRKLKKEYGIK